MTTLLEILGIRVQLSEYDRARVEAYSSILSRESDGTPRRLGYESEHPHYNPHPPAVRYCGACMSVATLCACDWKYCLPIGAPPPAGPYSLAVFGDAQDSQSAGGAETKAPTAADPAADPGTHDRGVTPGGRAWVQDEQPLATADQGCSAPPLSPTRPGPIDDDLHESPKESVGTFAPPPVVFDAWTDGSGTTALKDAGIGVVLLRNGEVICEASSWIGPGSNNIAEICAIRRALRLVFDITHDRLHPVTIHSDSEFAIGAITSTRWDVRRNPKLVELVRVMRVEVARWPHLSFIHVRGHSGLEHNERADELAGRARKQGLAIRARQFAAEAEKVRKLA